MGLHTDDVHQLYMSVKYLLQYYPILCFSHVCTWYELANMHSHISVYSHICMHVSTQENLSNTHTHRKCMFDVQLHYMHGGHRTKCVELKILKNSELKTLIVFLYTKLED